MRPAAFLTILLVENTVNALFRMTSRGSDPPFATLAQAQKLFLDFRFFASSFVPSLSSYVYDDEDLSTIKSQDESWSKKTTTAMTFDSLYVRHW